MLVAVVSTAKSSTLLAMYFISLTHLHVKHVAQRFQKLIYLHLFTDCFVNISHHSAEQAQCLQNYVCFVSDDLGHILMKLFINKST